MKSPRKMMFGLPPSKKKPSPERSLDDGAGNPSAERDEAFRRAIFAIPPGKVSTYGDVASAAGYPRYHRFVARLLHQDHWDQLPWHRVLGADGAIKTSGASAKEQRARLRLEGVKFNGDRVDPAAFLPRGKQARPPAEHEE
jgi:methylated-DNA-protein-cysteine methyltransferase related protein